MDIVLMTNENDSSDGLPMENDASFKIYACKLCSSFSTSYKDIENHIHENHHSLDVNTKDQILEIVPETQNGAKENEEMNMNITVVSNSQSENNLESEDVPCGAFQDQAWDFNLFRSDSEEKDLIAGTYDAYANIIPAKSIFNSEPERMEFEKQCKEFDYSITDNMFTKQVVPIDGTSSQNTQLHIFCCNTCQKTFKLELQVRVHCLTHTDLKPFKCSVCEFACNVKANLLSHMRRHTGNMYDCPKCSFKSCNRMHAIDHLQTHESNKIKCELCGNFYHTAKSLIQHVRKSHFDDEEGQEYLSTFVNKSNRNIMYECNHCNKMFKSLKERNIHLHVHKLPGTAGNYDCKFCSYKASRASYLRNHYRKHSILYFCAFCNTVELSSFNLKQHLKDHLDLTADESEIADPNELQATANSSFETKINALFEVCLEKCWYLPEPGQSKALNQNIHIPDELMEQLPCDDITDDGSDNSSQNNGVDQASLATDPIKALRYKQLSRDIWMKIRETFGRNECNICGRLFHSNIHLDRHFYVHISDKPFKCPSCEYSSTTKENLKRHEEVVHENKSFSCEHCPSVFNSRTGLWKHKRIHAEAEVECKKCGEKFTTRYKLRKHLLNRHPEVSKEEAEEMTGLPGRTHSYLGRQSYKCPHCNRLFHGSRSDLQKHMWIHEGIKPFKCPICPHAARSRNCLSNHMVRHCDFKTFLCEDCGKSYKSKGTLLAHMKTHKQSEDSSTDPNSSVVSNEAINEQKDEQMEFQEATVLNQQIGEVDYSTLTAEKNLDNIKDEESLYLEPVATENSDQLHQILETSEPILDEQAAINLIQQIVQQGALFNANSNDLAENGLQTFIVADGLNEGKKFVIQYIADNNAE